MKAALVVMGVSLLGKQTFAYNNRGSFHLDERSGRNYFYITDNLTVPVFVIRV